MPLRKIPTMCCKSSTARCTPHYTVCRTAAGSLLFWGTSKNNRKAKYYRLTPEGKKQLASQTSRWEQLVNAIARILNPAREGQS